jgi:transcriptional regulator with PAS, ATPase and Fis domain
VPNLLINQKKLKITVVTGYPILTEMAKKVNVPDVELKVLEVVGEKAVSSLMLGDCDVVIGRGATYNALKEKYRGAANAIPCVELQVSGYDVVMALQRCKDRYGTRMIAVIGSKNMVDGVQDVAKSMGFKLLHFIATNEEETRQSLRKSVENGLDIVIGGGLVNRLAYEFPVTVFIIQSGETALLHAIEEAKRTADVAMKERAVAVRMQTILDNIHEGVVAVDLNGCITVCNTPARLGLGGVAGEELIGRNISTVMPGSAIRTVLENAVPQLGVIYKKDKNILVQNLQPILVNNTLAGVTITFQEAVSLQELEGKLRHTMHEKGHTARYTFNDCIGESFAIQEALARAIKFSRVNSNIILYGETGTGKEVFAQSIHNASVRREGPFVAVNCAALPENLLESELFGYVSGAFTGASRGGKMGLFEMAHGGTIFLDEVSEIPVTLQGRLLRVLQEQKVMRLGHDRVLPIDVRVIAASNKNLDKLAEQELFRQDLLYRLDVLHITIPPLRERGKDIPALASAFVREAGIRLRGQPVYLDPEAGEVLRLYEWPGNVRELYNICERICALSSSQVIQARDVYEAFDQFEASCPLPEYMLLPDSSYASSAELPYSARPEASFSPRPEQPHAPSSEPSYPVRREQSYAPYPEPHLEERAPRLSLEKALALSGNNKSRAAQMLGISRTTLWRRMREAGLGE